MMKLYNINNGESGLYKRKLKYVLENNYGDCKQISKISTGEEVNTLDRDFK